MAISSLGIGSGLDLSTLVETLLAAERAPKENSLNRQEETLTTQLSGLGIFRGALTTFQSSLSGLAEAENYGTRAYSNTNSSALSVAITNDAAVGSYNIDVTNLAEQHSLASASFSSLDEVVGEGTLQIRFGTITGPGFTDFTANAEALTQTIIVDSSNNTLEGLKDTINEGDYGVSASIIYDGTGYKLSLVSDDTGEAYGMEITVTDTGDGDNTDASGLSRLAYNASATQLTETQAAEDATLTVNGIAVTSSSNTLDSMIEGVTLTLKEETSGTAFNLNVSENTTAISSSITNVVDAFNVMMSTLNELSFAGGEDSDSSGLLVSDSSLRTFVSSVRSLLTGSISGLSGSITALSTIGITTQSDGTLSIDQTVFNEAISENPTGALALFAAVGQSQDDGYSFNGYTDDSVAGNYAVNITQMATQSSLSGSIGLSFPLVIDDDNDNISFEIDGVKTGNLSLTQGTYNSGEELAAELQNRINSSSNVRDSSSSVTVTYDSTNQGFVITSDQYGSDSLVEITAIDTNTAAELGLSVQTATAGLDVAGTIDGQTATGSGQVLTATSGDANGLSITVDGGTTGTRLNLEFSRGLIEGLNDLLDSYVDSDGVLSAREDGLNESLEQIEEDRLALEYRLEIIETQLINQYTALDALVASYQSTSDFITQQIDSLPGSGQLLNND